MKLISIHLLLSITGTPDETFQVNQILIGVSKFLLKLLVLLMSHLFMTDAKRLE